MASLSAARARRRWSAASARERAPDAGGRRAGDAEGVVDARRRLAEDGGGGRIARAMESTESRRRLNP